MLKPRLTPIATRTRGKIRFFMLGVVVAGAIAIFIAWNIYAVRSAVRWRANSGRYKRAVLAQPVSPSGELQHIEWDGWGWGGQDTTVYLVFDSSNLLAAPAASGQPGRYAGIPCDVARVRRLETNWYTVQMFTDGDCWQP